MPRILLLGGDVDFNVGDAAIQHAVCSTLAGLNSAVRITVVSALPNAPRPPGVIAALPKGSRHAAAQWSAAREQDLIVIGGGGLLQDDDSRVKMPYWTARLAALHLAQPRIAGHCLGAGPLLHAESRVLARAACATMRSITVRDEIARRTLQACTAKQVAVVPDPAFMLEPAPAAEARRHLATLGIPAGRPPIGVVVRRWFHKRGGFLPHQLRSRLGLDRGEGAAPMRDFIGVIAGALTRLARRLDTGVLLLPSYHSAHEGDLDACNMLAARIEGAEVHVARITSPTLYKAVTGELRLLISARMHPLILAAGMGVPLMGIGYNSKFTGCMESLGIADQLLWFDDFTGDPGGEMLERRALAALASPVDLVARASALAQRSREATAKLLDLIE